MRTGVIAKVLSWVGAVALEKNKKANGVADSCLDL